MSGKKVAIFPGSFNPWHDGHQEILQKALCVFDKVIVAVGINLEKNQTDQYSNVLKLKEDVLSYGVKNGCIEVVAFDCLLADFVQGYNKDARNIHAVIRGLRNINDFEYEKTQQYWNAELKIGIPTYYIISSASLQHVSSSAIRMIEKLGGK